MFIYNQKGSWQIDEVMPLTIGKNSKNKIVVTDRYASKFHAEIVFQGDDLVIRDLNSTNGVWVNGRKIPGVSVLKDGDRLHIGQNVFWISDNKTDLLLSWSDKFQIFLVKNGRLLKLLLALMPVLMILEGRLHVLEPIIRVISDLIGLL